MYNECEIEPENDVVLNHIVPNNLGLLGVANLISNKLKPEAKEVIIIKEVG